MRGEGCAYRVSKLPINVAKLNRASTVLRPAFASRCRRSSSRSTRRIASESVAGSLAGTSNPLTSDSMISGTPPTDVATMASPAAIASRTEFGIPSDCDGNTDMSQQARSSGTSLRAPRNRKLLSRPAACTCCSNTGRSWPSPIRTNFACGNARQIVCAADTRHACPLMRQCMFATIAMSFEPLRRSARSSVSSGRSNHRPRCEPQCRRDV